MRVLLKSKHKKTVPESKIRPNFLYKIINWEKITFLGFKK